MLTLDVKRCLLQYDKNSDRSFPPYFHNFFFGPVVEQWQSKHVNKNVDKPNKIITPLKAVLGKVTFESTALQYWVTSQKSN